MNMVAAIAATRTSQSRWFHTTRGIPFSKCRSRRRFTNATSCNNSKLPQQTIVNELQVRAATQKWFQTIVCGQQLCPFAPPFLRNPHLMRIAVSYASDEREAVLDVSHQVRDLMRPSQEKQQQQQQHETTLVVLAHPALVPDYRDLIHLSWTLQQEAVLDLGLTNNDLQLVLFHPKATHETYATTSEESAAADYTIRSPFPTVHLLREQDVLKGVGKVPDLETLPARNKLKLEQQGREVCQARLEQCYQEQTQTRQEHGPKRP